MTIQSVLRLIGKFVHAVLTGVGAFFVLYYIMEVILNYTWGARVATFTDWPLLLGVIFASLYMWLDRPKRIE